MAGLLLGSLLSATLLLVAVGASPIADKGKDVDLLMPNVQPRKNDTYLCISREMTDPATYLNKFVPHANMKIAHHMLLYACEEPGSADEVWGCGEMTSPESTIDVGPVCAKGSKIIYAWAMGAPELTLPEGVAFKVGAATEGKYLVLQVHYKDVTKFLPPISAKDDSGVTVHTSTVATPKRAGVYLLVSGGQLQPKSTVYMETACSYDEPETIHPFAYRVHAHRHGEVVSGYRVRDGKWEEIGRMSPKKEQMFYPVSHPGMEVKPGDTLAARCTMVNNEERLVKIGATQNDEMCNFYVMYYVDGDTIPQENSCFNMGPPLWSWDQFGAGLSLGNEPNDISIIPGTDKVLEQTIGDIVQEKEELMDRFRDMQLPGLMEDDFLLGGDESLNLFRDDDESDSYEGFPGNLGKLPYRKYTPDIDFERLLSDDSSLDWEDRY